MSKKKREVTVNPATLGTVYHLRVASSRWFIQEQDGAMRGLLEPDLFL